MQFFGYRFLNRNQKAKSEYFVYSKFEHFRKTKDYGSLGISTHMEENENNLYFFLWGSIVNPCRARPRKKVLKIRRFFFVLWCLKILNYSLPQ
jgi:hypothetical protein